MAKTEKLVTHRELNYGKVNDALIPASTLVPSLDINDECEKVQLALDALSLVFGEIELLNVEKQSLK